MNSVCDWSGLLPELLSQIASNFSMIEDFMAFRGVCTSWRAAATKEDKKFESVSNVPLLMLSQNKYGCDEREFYSLSKRKICTRMSFPGAMGKRCMDVGFGWIITLNSGGDVSLVKPFSSAKIDLPNYRRFPLYSRTEPPFYFIDGAWLTANPCKTSDFKLVVSVNQSSGFWKNGDENWTERRDIGCLGCFQNGKLYTLDFQGHVLIWDPHETDLSKPQEIVKVEDAPTFRCYSWFDYLVGSTNGELLIIRRNNIALDEYVTVGANHFGVKRVDLVKGKCIEIDSLGNDAIFLGNNAAVSVDATEFPGVLKSNCIYFTDDCMAGYFNNTKACPKGGGKDMGIYNVEDRSIERFDVESYGRVCPPMWVFPSF